MSCLAKSKLITACVEAASQIATCEQRSLPVQQLLRAINRRPACPQALLQAASHMWPCSAHTPGEEMWAACVSGVAAWGTVLAKEQGSLPAGKLSQVQSLLLAPLQTLPVKTLPVKTHTAAIGGVLAATLLWKLMPETSTAVWQLCTSTHRQGLQQACKLRQIALQAMEALALLWHKAWDAAAEHMSSISAASAKPLLPAFASCAAALSQLLHPSHPLLGDQDR